MAKIRHFMNKIQIPFFVFLAICSYLSFKGIEKKEDMKSLLTE